MSMESNAEVVSLYADWFDRMLRSDNLDLSVLGAQASHISDAFEDFIRDRLFQERGFSATDNQIQVLDRVRRAFLDVDAIAEAGTVRGRTVTRFRDIATGRFTGLRNIISKIVEGE
jgi:hypothetical protein